MRTTDLYSEEDKSMQTGFGEASAIQTYYEKMWMERGIPIKYQKFALPKDGQLTEPEVEIELDEYRSYHRDKRSSLSVAK